MKRGPLLAALVLAAASAGALAFGVSHSGTAVRPVPPGSDILRRAGETAAREALGRRVLVLTADPGKPRTSEILESSRAPEGWALYPATPPGAGEFGSWLASLAATAAASWDRDAGLPQDLRPALALFCVKALVVDDAGKGAPPVRIFEQAEPVLRIGGADGGAAAGAGAKDVRALAAGLAATPARESEGWTWEDWDDSLWGGAVTVRTERAGRFVFPYPAVGGHVTIDGAEAARGAAGPLLVLDLPAGVSRVDVQFAERGSGEVFTVLGAAGIVASLLLLILAFRPSRAELVAEAERRAAAGS